MYKKMYGETRAEKMEAKLKEEKGIDITGEN